MACARTMFRSLAQQTARCSSRSALSAVSSPLRSRPQSMAFLRSVSTTRYTEAHEWVTYDADKPEVAATVGITDYAQNSLGDIVFVELPLPDTQVSQGDQIGAVESVKAASDIFAPVSGVIESVNQALDDKPSTVNSAAESDGWLCKMSLTNDSEFKELMSEEAYLKHCEGEEDH